VAAEQPGTGDARVPDAESRRRRRGRRKPLGSRPRLLWIGAVAGCAVLVAVLATAQSRNARDAIPFIVVALLIIVGGALALKPEQAPEPLPRSRTSSTAPGSSVSLAVPASLRSPARLPWANAAEIGRGLFVSGVLGLALLWLQNHEAADLRRAQQAQDHRAHEADVQRQRIADQRQLQLTLGMRHDLRAAALDGRRLDGFYLGHKNLGGAQLAHASLARADLTGSRLSGANLEGAVLAGSDLDSVTMTGVGVLKSVLQNVDMRFAVLSRAQITGYSLFEVDLSRVDAEDAELAGDFMSDVSFRQADLRRAILDDSEFDPSYLEDLRDADMEGVRADSTQLSGADLTGADLCESDLRYASLDGADLSRADLRGADLRHVLFDHTKLSGALFDVRTRWPRSFDPSRHGATLAKNRLCQDGRSLTSAPRYPVGPGHSALDTKIGTVTVPGFAPALWVRMPHSPAEQLRGEPGAPEL
jgi:uncharacterized protein YjbI with pentapeptide repeats